MNWMDEASLGLDFDSLVESFDYIKQCGGRRWVSEGLIWISKIPVSQSEVITALDQNKGEAKTKQITNNHRQIVNERQHQTNRRNQIIELPLR